MKALKIERAENRKWNKEQSEKSAENKKPQKGVEDQENSELRLLIEIKRE